jgi:hypothetical protein
MKVSGMITKLCLICKFGLVISMLSLSCGGQADDQAENKIFPNSVAAYIENAEIQAETDEQRREIRRALLDILEKPATELRTQKYADYQGKPNEWSITRLLTAYFVPSTPQSLEPEQFYKDIDKPEAKLAIRHKLDAINQTLKESGNSY